ncbi:MAG TPA: WbqC family protein [Caulobacteraceae bacterium]|jgi:hypothetical protein|nr:WbqC family protein [Caulobacteraceae bacterium]
MTRTVAIMQPTYLPYLGYFDLIQRADVFVLLDDCQFERKSWQQRNRILGRDGEAMLSIILRKQPVETDIKDIEINDDLPWRRDHLREIKKAYAKAAFFEEGFGWMEAQLARPEPLLADLTCGMIEDAARKLSFGAELVRARTLACGGKRSDHSVEILRKLNADLYLSPLGSRAYIEADGIIAKANIPVKYRSYDPIPYPQTCAGFTPYMGFLDAVMNLGWNGLAEHMKLIAQQSHAP